MQVFWRQGYTATSLGQLLEEMKIGRSSLYAAFGGKRELFVEALDLFAARTRAILERGRRAGDAACAVRRFFRATLLDAPARRARYGCMMVNTILELAEVDDGLCELASRRLADIEDGFEACFKAALAEGSLVSERSPRELARFAMLANQGLRVASRRKTPRRELEEMIDTTLSMLGIEGG